MAPLTNDRHGYGLVAVTLHWLVAVLVYGLFGLGLWMVELTYYDPWYNRAPWWHKGLGVLLLAAFALRLAWRGWSPPPGPEPGLRRWEVRLSRLVHAAFYLLVLLLAVTGYLIVTAAGDPLDVFGWFAVPALVDDVDRLEDIAGEIHFWLAWTTLALAALHAAAALKHHLVDRDATLRRMLRPGPADD